MLREGETYPRLAWQLENDGDLNGDGVIDLKDLFISLRVTTGQSSSTILTEGDVDNNGRLGMSEALYIMSQLAE